LSFSNELLIVVLLTQRPAMIKPLGIMRNGASGMDGIGVGKIEEDD
jgi:hypothetical protein